MNSFEIIMQPATCLVGDKVINCIWFNPWLWCLAVFMVFVMIHLVLLSSYSSKRFVEVVK